jgi:thiol-disulfide isomerase/thioredoxin
MEDLRMLSRRSILFATLIATAAAGAMLGKPALATETKPFTRDAFAAAQRAGKPIFVEIHASWCPICAKQRPILSEIMADPKFKNLVYFVVDFDSQKDAVSAFGVRMQSTLIAFKGEKETGRSVGDTDRTSIAALLNKTL